MHPIALTIAGSDSGGGAGIQADLKTFHQFGVHGTSAIVAITAQNTVGVRAIHAVPADIVEAQLAAIADDLPPDAVKTGMLATSTLVSQVARAIRAYGWSRYVLDPVMVSTSGQRLLDPTAERMVLEELMPLALIVTPNLDEAVALAERMGITVPRRDVQDWMADLGGALIRQGARSALIKGGHLDRRELVDLLVLPDSSTPFRHPKIETTSTHGTGCTLSAAITAGLARAGRGPHNDVGQLESIVLTAVEFVQRALALAPGLGRGHGPLNHSVAATSDSGIISNPAEPPKSSATAVKPSGTSSDPPSKRTQIK